MYVNADMQGLGVVGLIGVAVVCKIFAESQYEVEARSKKG